MDECFPDELAALRERVRVLAAGLGVDETFDVPADARRHAVAGETESAIRELRRQTPGRLSLVVAKRMVNALQR
jgi:hypothetical protein